MGGMRSHLLSWFSLGAAVALAAPDYPVQPVPFTAVRFTDGLLHDRQATNTAVTLPFALEQCETSGRLRNFDLAAEVMRRRVAGETNFQIRPPTQYPFDDTDVFKAIEGAAFSLSVRPDPALAARLEAMIRRVAAAQEPDGYLYTFRTMHPDSPGHGWIGRQRWEKDPQLSHELYNLGHLFEAGTAHYQATGSRSLLEVCLKAAELLHRDFSDGEPRIAPGHQVIEMGLVRLHRQTGDPRWLGLACFFLENRGRGGEYSQDHRPVLEQDRAVGHAVRANYLYAGMADVAALTGDARYSDAIHRIWRNVVGTKLHLTGGCGARASGEAYGDDYELPHRCYNETCAAVAFLFWNHRMFLLTGEGRFMDVFERTLYNGALSGVSLSGDRFFYPNPLEYDGQAKNNHGHAGRAPWFGCACCPPNIMRTLAALGGSVCAVRNDTLFVNLYAASAATATLAGTRVELKQVTDYPWNGTIRIHVIPEKPVRFTLALRIPGWVEGRPLPSDLYRYDDATPAPWTVEVNGERQSFARPAAEGTSPGADAARDRPEIRDGFAHLSRDWRAGDTLTLELPMPVRRVAGHPRIAATRNQVALERGPIVYAFEGVDNDGAVFDLVLPETARITPEHRPTLLGGVTVLRIDNAARARRDDTGALATRPAQLLAIPYATWANRGLTPMAVWLARDAATARPAPQPTLASQAKVTVSYARAGMSLAPINDQLLPENFTDGFAPNFDFWPRKGTTEWITYEFARPATVQAVRVSWFDDTGTGECRLPAAWRVLHRTSEGRWEPVNHTGDYPTQKRNPVRVRFPPVTTTALRLEIQLPPNFSAGVYEWEVE
jgi:DUF1680 family protein